MALADILSRRVPEGSAEWTQARVLAAEIGLTLADARKRIRAAAGNLAGAAVAAAAAASRLRGWLIGRSRPEYRVEYE
jgi:hypothetical protein